MPNRKPHSPPFQSFVNRRVHIAIEEGVKSEHRRETQRPEAKEERTEQKPFRQKRLQSGFKSSRRDERGD